MPSAALVSRISVTGLLCVFFVLTGLVIWGTTTTERVAEQTQASVLLSDDYQNAARAVEHEATTERTYRLDPSAVGVAAQWTAADMTADALLKIGADGDADDRSIVRACLKDHEAYKEAVDFMFHAVDMGETVFAALLELRNVEPFFEPIAQRVGRRGDVLHRRALESLAALTLTQHTVRRTMLIALTVGLLFLGVFIAILRSYSQRLDAAHAAEINQLSRAALTDNLTRLGNHRAFQDVLQRSVRDAALTGNTLTLAIVDVDEFKTINDRNGHPFGDEVLSMLGALLASIRVGDLITAYRIGGDEFAIILPGIALRDALPIIVRFRALCASERLSATLSIGVAEMVPGTADVATLRAHADAALYDAKRRGRDRLTTYDEIGRNENECARREKP